MREAFALGSKDALTPNELLRAMLTAPMDLLWFGGIGTYIKARTENNVDVGDRANDVIRINGDEIKAKIIGEGANLGATQLGRIDMRWPAVASIPISSTIPPASAVPIMRSISRSC